MIKLKKYVKGEDSHMDRCVAILEEEMNCGDGPSHVISGEDAFADIVFCEDWTFVLNEGWDQPEECFHGGDEDFIRGPDEWPGLEEMIENGNVVKEGDDLYAKLTHTLL
jgi:hypothetical protein